MSGAWSIPTTIEFRGAQLSSVRFPSQKAVLFDRTGAGGGGAWRSVFSPDARALSLAADGSVRSETTRNVNPGWVPTSPTSAAHTWVSYSPALWEPRRFPTGVSQYPAYYRYTRGGPAGRDFGGPEVDTGQP
jgi:hypothetical protein